MKTSRSDLRKKAFELIFQSSVVSAEEAIEIARVETPEFFENSYVEAAVKGTEAKSEEIDKLITKHLKPGWSVKRLSKVSLSVLRLAIFEMMYIEDVPGGVAINEAVEIAKSYGDEKDPAFVNGILASIFKEISK